MPTIRDESGEWPHGVSPERVFEWAARPWTPEERAEFREFVVVCGELAFKRAEKQILDSGGCDIGLGIIDARAYWLPEDALVGVFDVGRDLEKALVSQRTSRGNPFARAYHRMKYRSELRIGLAHDVYLMRACARVALLQRSDEVSGAELTERFSKAVSDAEIQYYSRLMFSPIIAVVALVLLLDLTQFLARWVLRRFAGEIESEDKDTATVAAGKFENQAARADTAGQVKISGELQGEPRRGEPVIQDETGEQMFGVDPARILNGTLRIWAPEDRAYVLRIILIGSHSTKKDQELGLARRRAKPLHPWRGDLRTYYLKPDGAIVLADFSKLFGELRMYRDSRPMNWARNRYVAWRIKSALRAKSISKLPHCLAWARAVGEPGGHRLSKTDLAQRQSDVMWHSLYPRMLKSVRYWSYLARFAPLALLIIWKRGHRCTEGVEQRQRESRRNKPPLPRR